MEILKIILFIFLGLLLIWFIGSLIALFIYKDTIWPKMPIVDKTKIHIACVGDSITFGAGVLKDRNKASYPAILQNIVGENYQVLNYGYSGRTLLDEGDYPYKKEKHYTESIKSESDYYIIMLGTNDSKPYNWNNKKYEEELDLFIKDYKNLPNNPKIIVMQPSRCFEQKNGKIGFDINNEVIKNEVYKIVNEVATNNNVYQIIDLYELTKDHPEYFVDGVHPNKLGNEVIAKEISKYIL